MVAIIKTSTSLRRPFHYNENKIKQGVAELLFAQNYPIKNAEQTAELRLKYLLKLASLNPRTGVNAVHISLNFAPGEEFETKKLQHISREYMKGIGFENQPYLVYRHTDAGHPHLHIVTTNIALDGKRIPLHNIGRLKSEPTRKAIEKEFGLVPAESQKQGLFIPKPVSISRLDYGKSETKRAIGNVLQHVLKSYKFTSLPELNAVLNQYRIVADRGREESRIFKKRGLVYRVMDEQGNNVGVPIKASSFYFKATLNSIESKFESNEMKRKNHIKSIRSAIDLTLVKMSEKSLDEVIKSLEKQGIVTIKRENQEGRLYGITFVDHRTKCVFNGSALGKNYSAKGLMDRTAIQSEKSGFSPESLTKTGRQMGGKQEGQPEITIGEIGQTQHALNDSRGLLETVVSPEETYSYLPFEWRKKKRKRKKKVTK
ncbi:relaxase/mobilization nuclease domain-containing protein [Algoriphagus sp. D3-2-R+10]|uniref:relaxase/mobilization nuclease domain-containing protein n=1 Tax=Algoriphagus aurantiacus TaxID=3103948 RepID=UPI002B3F536B|nr:relaxase/mobilization nuclease domain-containing protein [Algoriphagus sp. D3-2-R+10]MEB2776487.1 relaxase/mobilization nuclease domain-containing protein [Algoriphagus sp. D3-2-R+10]